MRISHSSYQKYIVDLAKKIEGKTLFSPILLNNETLMFPFADDYTNSLIISLNNKCPLVYVINSDAFYSSLENSFIKRFRKYLNRTIISDIKLDETDNILYFTLTSIIEDATRNYIVELIPNCPNLIELNNGLIQDIFFKNKNRNLSWGESYQKPKSFNELIGDQEITSDFLYSHFLNECDNRYKEKYNDFFKFLNTRIKSVNRKISSIKNDVKKAEDNLLFKDYADEIFTLGIDLKNRTEKLELSKTTVSLDSSKTISENCQLFYKRAKRAKETINHSLPNIENAEKSLIEFKEILEKFNNGNEKEKDALVAAYFPVNKKRETQETILNRPWKYNLNGTFIYFGKNASQNDYLSFVMKLDREYTWLHIKDLSGAHLVICNRKPTENELLFACEFALLCSHQKTGEIVYTKKKNVRRGHTLGEAIIKNQMTIKLNRIREETIAAFALAKRID